MKHLTYIIPVSMIPVLLLGSIIKNKSELANVIPRSGWKAAEESIPEDVEQLKNQDSKDIQFLSIHYTGSWVNHPDYSTRELLRNIQSGHINDDRLGDIAYHYLVTENGEIFSGRSLSKAPASKTYYLTPSELERGRESVNKGRVSLKKSFKDGIKGKEPGNTKGHITVSFVCGLKPKKQDGKVVRL